MLADGRVASAEHAASLRVPLSAPTMRMLLAISNGCDPSSNSPLASMSVSPSSAASSAARIVAYWHTTPQPTRNVRPQLSGHAECGAGSHLTLEA